MRMWMVPPRYMCRRHLLGEHLEIHMFLGTLKKGNKIDGYLKNNCCEPRSFKERHDALVEEMQGRGMTGHKTPIEENDCSCICDLPLEQQNWKVDSIQSAEDLFRRCPVCFKRYEEIEEK